MKQTERIEPELIQQCLSGSRDAQRKIYERTSQRIHAVIMRMIGNSHDAFDLTQQTYLRAFTRIHQFHEESTFETWLYRIAVNEVLQFIRRGKSRSTFSLSHPEPARMDPQAALQIDVRESLAKLSAEDRTVLLLRYQEGLDYRTIAEITGQAEGTVASRLNRARGRLRDHLEKGYGLQEGLAVTEHHN